MERTIDPIEYLNNELAERIRKNESYSLRSFASALKLSPGQLSEILRGKRPISLKGALKIVKALALSPKEGELFLRSVQMQEAERSGIVIESKKLGSRQLSDDLFRIIADWYCFAILNLAETKGFVFKMGVIAQRLGISVTDAKLALDRLERVGLILNQNGKLSVAPDYVISPDEIPSEAVRRCHAQLLDKAKLALDQQELSEREIGGVTFSIDTRRLPEFKKDLKSFLDQWAEKASRLDRNTRNEVYHLETILFRLSQKRKPS